MARRLTSIVVAVLATVVLFYIADAVGADLQIRMGLSGDLVEMTVVNVVFVTVVAGVLGLILAVIFDRVRNGRAIWTAVAVVVLVASLGLLGQLESTTSDLIWQALLHLVFGVVLIVGFYTGWPEREEPAAEGSQE